MFKNFAKFARKHLCPKHFLIQNTFFTEHLRKTSLECPYFCNLYLALIFSFLQFNNFWILEILLKSMLLFIFETLSPETIWNVNWFIFWYVFLHLCVMKKVLLLPFFFFFHHPISRRTGQCFLPMILRLLPRRRVVIVEFFYWTHRQIFSQDSLPFYSRREWPVLA